ncbi:YDG domain-containing protein [Comamonas sp. GB3 AK4-5]|uniref:YDG domain-containing protein n=1 Tax=Comamonas sp. GB3 AK4-5 TaxID=3231487 RepID=UPI00351F0750
MNHSYRLVWNQEAQRYVPAPECAKGRGKSKAGKALAPAAVLLAAAFALPTWAAPPAANALPTGGQVVSGNASIGQSGSQMTVNQSSPKAIIDWTSFDIGKNAGVTFVQPNANAVALNRVTAGDASQIHGQLNANGQVWLINPNGVVFGQGSKVDVGGLVASTLNITNADFNNGNYRFTRNGATGSIVNQGELTAKDGGYVALLAPTVRNDRIIRAQLGTVAMAAGDQITLQAGANGLLNVQVDPATVRTLIENKQLIVADGGQVIMTGKAADALSASVVANTGTIQANSLQAKDGKILLIADMRHGETKAAGQLEAKFVDTSAATVSIDKDLKVNTHGGQWLIDPVDITIDASKAQAIEAALGTGNVTVSTSNGHTNPGESDANNGSDPGDIHVNAAITYTQNKLTLNADRNINLNAAISVNGMGTLALNYGTQGNINASFGANGGFAGKVNFAQSGTGLLDINGSGYTVIKDAAALQAMNGNLSGKHVLGGDIDASGVTDFVPIGSSPASAFTGVFDGLGHTVSDLTINRPDQDRVGLFRATDAATLRNVGLEGGSVTGKDYVGGLVGYSANASISHAYATGAVTGAKYVGGLVGKNSSSWNNASASISHAYATGAVTGANYVGGLVGENSSSRNNASASISHAYATGAVTGANYVGGLVGSNSSAWDSASASISHAYATGAVTGADYVGGLVGENSGFWDSASASISHAYATGAVTGTRSSVGGLVGDKRGGGSITESFWSITTTGRSNSAGGLGKMAAELADANLYSNWDSSVWNLNLTGRGSTVAGYEMARLPSLAGMTRTQDVQGITLFAGGMGTVGDAYSITDWQQLQNINHGADTLAGYYQLNADLNKNSVGYSDFASATANGGLGWRPIGDGNTDRFMGVFKGQGHTIGDLVVKVTSPNFTAGNGETYSDAGLFGTTRDAWIEQVGLINATVSASGADINRAGALVGSVWGNTTIIQSYVSNANVTASGGTSSYAGGLLGRSSGIAATGRPNITHNYVSGGTVQAQGGSQFSEAGGLVGAMGGGDIDQSYVSTTVSAESTSGYIYAGGLTGAFSTTGQFSSTATNSFWNSSLISESKGGTGKTAEELKQASTFAGWDLSANGGEATIWRIYEGQSGPLLRGFLKQITVTADASQTGKTYDGTAASGTATYTTNVTGATLNGSLDYATNSKNAGDYSTAGGGLTLSKNLYSGQQGYDISYATTNAALTIVQKAITVTGMTADNKAYDGTTTATLSGGSLSGVLGTDTVTLSGQNGAFANKNAGIGKTVTVSSITLGGDDAGNYTVTQPTGLTANITAKALTVTGMTADNKAYDGGTTATLSGGSLSGVLGTDAVTLSGQNGAFANKNAGIGKTVTVSSITLGGDDAGNYTVTQPTDLTANITAKALTVTGMTADNKAYDGGTTATLSGGSLSGVLGTDTVTLSGQNGAFANKNAGIGKTVTVSSITLGGDDAGNYTVTQPTGLTANITAKALTVTGMTAANKTYDGGTTATLSGGSLSGVLGTDAVTFSGQNGAFANKNAGTGKTVTVSGITLGGDDAGNYTVTQPTGLTANITAKALTVTGMTADNKAYDGGTTATLSGGSLSGVLGTDTVTFSGQNGAFANKNAGTGKTVTVSGITLGGDDAGNYTVSQPTGLQADIDRAAITISTDAVSKTYDGTTSVAGGAAKVIVGQLFGSDALSGGSFAYTDKNAGANKTVNVSGMAVNDGNNGGNYDVSYVANTGSTIDKAALTISAGDARKTQGEVLALGSSTGFTVGTGLVSGETVGSVQLSSPGTPAGAAVGRYDIHASGASGSGGFDAGNYAITYEKGQLTVAASPVPPPGSPVIDVPSGGAIWLAQSRHESVASDSQSWLSVMSPVLPQAGGSLSVAGGVPNLTLAPGFIRVQEGE